jgi:hypothetical protein
VASTAVFRRERRRARAAPHSSSALYARCNAEPAPSSGLVLCACGGAREGRVAGRRGALLRCAQSSRGARCHPSRGRKMLRLDPHRMRSIAAAATAAWRRCSGTRRCGGVRCHRSLWCAAAFVNVEAVIVWILWLLAICIGIIV